MDVSSVVGTAGGDASNAGQRSTTEALAGMDLEGFLDLMIAELQNQDPLNPLENNEILQTVSQIREIGATNQLQDTLEAVLLGQSLNNAASLIGKQVEALDEESNTISGAVDRISVAGGEVTLHIGDQSAKLQNVREILPAE